MAEGDLDAVLAVHLKGTFGTMRHAVAYWRGRTADATGEHLVRLREGRVRARRRLHLGHQTQ
jgi:hypothetical protein